MLQVGTVALFQMCHKRVEIQSLVDLVSRWSWWMKPRNRLVMNRYSVESLREQSGGWIIVILVNPRLSRRCSRTSCMDWQHHRLFQQTLGTALGIYPRACGSPKGGTCSRSPRGTAPFLGVLDLLWLVCIIAVVHRLFRCTGNGQYWNSVSKSRKAVALTMRKANSPSTSSRSGSVATMTSDCC